MCRRKSFFLFFVPSKTFNAFKCGYGELFTLILNDVDISMENRNRIHNWNVNKQKEFRKRKQFVVSNKEIFKNESTFCKQKRFLKFDKVYLQRTQRLTWSDSSTSKINIWSYVQHVPVHSTKIIFRFFSENAKLYPLPRSWKYSDRIMHQQQSSSHQKNS